MSERSNREGMQIHMNRRLLVYVVIFGVGVVLAACSNLPGQEADAPPDCEGIAQRIWEGMSEDERGPCDDTLEPRTVGPDCHPWGFEPGDEHPGWDGWVCTDEGWREVGRLETPEPAEEGGDAGEGGDGQGEGEGEDEEGGDRGQADDDEAVEVAGYPQTAEEVFDLVRYRGDVGAIPEGERAIVLGDIHQEIGQDGVWTGGWMFITERNAAEGDSFPAVWVDFTAFDYRNFGFMARAEDREAYGLTREECQLLGYNSTHTGSTIPGGFVGAVNGFTIYPRENHALGVLPFERQTVSQE